MTTPTPRQPRPDEPPHDLSEQAAAELRKIIGGSTVADKRQYGRMPLPKKRKGR